MARVSLDTLIERSIRNMGNVHPAVRDRIVYLLTKAYGEGIQAQISSGYRSPKEQQALFNKGRFGNEGRIVTKARPGQSVHNYGLAVDYFLTNEDGTKAIWDVNDQWRRVAEIAKSLGFTWGGDWSSFRDYPHLELTGGLGWRDLKAGKRPTHLFNQGETQRGHTGMSVAELQEDLKQAGYAITVDGIFGPETERVLKQFQQDHNVKVDGIYGPRTKAVMQTVLHSSSDKPSAWAASNWDEAVKNGYVDGTRPKDPLTREEAAVIINRLRHNFLSEIEKNEQEIRELRQQIEELRKSRE